MKEKKRKVLVQCTNQHCGKIYKTTDPEKPCRFCGYEVFQTQEDANHHDGQFIE